MPLITSNPNTMSSKNTSKYDSYSDACGVEEQRLRQEQSLAMADARMLPAVSNPDMLPADLAEEVTAQACKDHLSQMQAVASHRMRDKMDIALAYYGADLMNADPCAAEDAMITRIDGDTVEDSEDNYDAVNPEVVDSYSEMLEPEVRTLPGAKKEPKLVFKKPNRTGLRKAA